MNNNPRVYLSPPHLSGKEQAFVQQAFDENWVAPIGPHINAFEEEVCGYTGAGHAVALSSGTAAIHLALLLLGVRRDDEIICSDFTFIGSANPIMHLGATPVFVDSERQSWNMDPALLKTALEDRHKKGKSVKAVVVVHLYGQSADMDAITEICSQYDVPVVEDAAESLGATYRDRHTGTIAPLGIYSFNGNKIITTSGGGMLVGKNRELIERARFLATQARDPAPHYEHSVVGYNYRMSNIAAGIGRGQILVLDDRIGRKREIFDFYVRKLGETPGFSFMPEPDYGRANRWLTCVLIDPAKCRGDREAVRTALEKQNIESRPLWKPMHLQPVFQGIPFYTGGVSEALFRDGLCLPSGTAMSEETLEQIVDTIQAVVL